ncbi:MAG: hypothetical protein K8H86_02175, partial [Ignavibacteriaceae bacterium]|nr:hypothetical protein [Ignavibacteriaceae bacterium]
VNITNKNGFYFVRFYDFQPSHWNFNILKFNAQKPAEREIVTTNLFPYSSEHFHNALSQNHFVNIKLYSSLSFAKFDEFESKDLFVCAGKA